MTKKQGLYIFSIVTLLVQWAIGTVQFQCVPLFPTFHDQGGHSPVLLVGIQALVPAYRITCNGTLVRWGISTERRGQHNIHLQVWRPVDGYRTYSLAGVNTFNVKPTKGKKAFLLTPEPNERIAVQEGDILGFHLENNATISNDFSIEYFTNVTGIDVHYTPIAQPLREIDSNTLHVTLMNAAPIIRTEIDPAPLPTEPTDTALSLPTEVITTNRPSTLVPTTSKSLATTESDIIPTTQAVHEPDTEDKGTTTTEEIDTTMVTERTTQTTSNQQFIVILIAMTGATVVVILISIIVVAVVIRCTMKKMNPEKQSRDVESADIHAQYTDDDYEYIEDSLYAAVIIPPQRTKEHSKTVPLKENPAYEQTLHVSLAHEYETPVILAPTRPLVSGYNIPRGTRAYNNIVHDYEDI